MFDLSVCSQEIIKQAPPGFDSLRADMSHGKIDTITYESKTVGLNGEQSSIPRQAFQKRTNTRFCIFCMALVAMKRNG
jgi:hypothetical protein